MVPGVVPGVGTRGGALGSGEVSPAQRMRSVTFHTLVLLQYTGTWRRGEHLGLQPELGHVGSGSLM